jgi:hypothetical protein
MTDSADKAQPPRNRAASTDRKLGRAILYALLSLVLVVLLFAIDPGNELLWVILFVPALLLGRLSYRHLKRRHGGGLSDEELGNKAPVLYLRPFDEDAGWDGAAPFSVFRPGTWTWRKVLLVSPTNLTALYLAMTGRLSFEQVLAHVVRKIGPLVAIGEPGSPPILGARNVYVGDDRWQEQVRDLARRSRLIVLTAGTSEGVLWEVGTMVAHSQPERFLLCVPGSSRGVRQRAYAAFQPLAAPLFPFGLPETLNGTRFLTFEAGWRPHAGKVAGSRDHAPRSVARKLRALLL